MKKYIFLTALVISLISCESSKEDSLIIPLNADNLPGKFIDAMTIDSKGSLWFSTSEIDNSVTMPSFSSSLPVRHYLTKYYENAFSIFDDRFTGAKEMTVDRDDNVWFITSKTLNCFTTSGSSEIYRLPDDKGLFGWITTDRDKNIWVGGLNTPLLKVTSGADINITKIVNELSSTSGHFDQNNDLWISLWDNFIGKRNTKGDWTYYNPSNSALPYQNFWCITSDNNNNIWAGTGWSDNSINLMRFNGSKWENIVPKDDLGNKISGTIRQLYADENKIWIVSEVSVSNAFDSGYLITYDGDKWNRIYDAPLKDGISGIELDLSNNKAYIGTKNSGCIQVQLK
jgi:ligand-binding sensor domain-containing protein